ncbi:MAG: DUF6174 domain-containing protein [Roseibacillus sp.]|jgi:hypothetical protein
MKTRILPSVVWLAWTVLILPIETTLAQGDQPQLELVAPTDGEQFRPGNTITLRATVINETGGPWQLEFFDGEERIGESIPNVPIWWRSASGGPHVITARATDPAGTTLISAPATILVGPGPTLPVLRVSARPWKIAEACITCDVVASTLTVRRAGSTDEALVVYLKTDGTATPGEDYPPLPTRVEIPAGQESMQLDLLALDDQLDEGPEIVRLRLVPAPSDSSSYLISVNAGTTMVVMRGGDEPDAPEARLDMVRPEGGARIQPGATIELSAFGVWTQGEIDRPVEFYDGDTLIAQSNPPISAAPPMPCWPRVHTVQWINPRPGEHVLTARYEILSGQWLISPPMHVTVDSALRIKSITLLDDELVELSIHTEVGKTYALESSHDLIHWMPTPNFDTIVALEKSIQLRVPRLPEATKQFYRLIQPELSQPQTDQNFNRQKWLSKGIQSYEFEFNWSCECSPDFTQSVVISVEHNSIVSIVARDTGNPIERSKWDYWKTVDELFDWIQEAIDGGGVNLERPESVTYDQELGYPATGYIDYRFIADEEIGFELQIPSISP